MHGGERKLDDECRAVAFAGAVHPDNAAVKLDEVLDDRQTQAQAAVFTGGGGVSLAELVEDIGQKCGADAATVVGNGKFKMRLDSRQPNPYLFAIGSELDCIVEKVPHDLLQARRVPRDHRDHGIAGSDYLDAFGVRGRLNRLQRRINHASKIHLLHIQP